MALDHAEGHACDAAEADDGEQKQTILDAELLLNTEANVSMCEIGDDRESKQSAGNSLSAALVMTRKGDGSEEGKPVQMIHTLLAAIEIRVDDPASAIVYRDQYIA